MPDINDVNGNPAIETDKPMSIQEANVWAIEQRGRADARKAAVERLRCAAAKRRERKPANPLEVLKPDPTYRVSDFNAEADAFNVESSDGKKLLGKSLSNGNVKNGQKTRAFFTPNGQVVIDVKPKGRDIVIPKPEAKPPVEEPDIWSVTSCFLYTRMKDVTEKLTGNGAAQGVEETSWSSMRVYSNSSFQSYAYGFAERLDDLGNYKSAEDALNNKLRPECLIVPTGGAGAGFAKDNAVIGSGSADAITIWFYIGNPADALTDGKIVQVTGPSFHPSNGNISDSGPGYCMEVYRGGFAGSAIFPSEAMGSGPLTQYLKQSFPELGGRIGYAGRIEKWRGMQDYSTTVSYFRDTPSPSQPNKTPTSVPSWYTPSPTVNPWQYTGGSWFQFGWPSPEYVGCASTSWINIEMTALNAATNCGASIAYDKWYWGGDASPSRGVLDSDNPSGFIGTTGMFVCWRGHVDHAGMAQSYFEAFRTYWGITGSVTKLGSANPYGCELPANQGGGYPPAPPSDARRFLVDAYGRKAKVLLVCHKQDYEPIEIELPFQYAAVVEEMRVLGGGSFGAGATFEANKSLKAIRTYGGSYPGPFSLDLVHGTLSIDAEFAYVDIFYGGERLHEEPKTLPLIIELAAQGFGSSNNYGSDNYGGNGYGNQRLGMSPVDYGMGGYYPSGWYQTPAQTGEQHPRFVKDCWSRCQSYKIKLPTKDDKTLTIVASQKYKRGETIAITANNPDSEFNNKWLIRDYRTDGNPTNLVLKTPNSDFASFGGLPALTQQQYLFGGYTNNDIPLAGLFYKNKQDWTKMDWIHYQLQEMPRQYNPLITVLPPGVSIQVNSVYAVNRIYDLDKKFGRHGRAEKIMPASSFGYTGTYTGGASPAYNLDGSVGVEPLFISHKEQLIGNGLIENGNLTKWYRVTTSSFPVHGQLLRNS